LAEYAIQEHGISERQACRILDVSRTVYRYQAKRSEDGPIREALQGIAQRKPSWGFRKMVDYLAQQRTGWNHKRIRRIYRDLGLNLRIKPRKRLPARNPLPLVQPERANQCWSLDVMSDSFAGGRTFRTLNILDDFNREVLWIEVDTSLPGDRVIRVLEMIASWRGYPGRIRMDNGPELISNALFNWAKKKGVELAHIQPGKPAQNAYIERFNRTFREDILDAYLFETMEEVREVVGPWIEEYNAIRPHESLQGLSPYQFAAANA
jgi:putative transposase